MNLLWLLLNGMVRTREIESEVEETRMMAIKNVLVGVRKMVFIFQGVREP
jgi:hypothetical protein